MNIVERNVRVDMLRPDLQRLPAVPLPHGFAARWYEAGDERLWLDIQKRTERHCPISPELFVKDFGNDPAVIHPRQCFLLDAAGQAVATATAWFDPDYHGAPAGRLHWVAVVPELQGRGLSKPLLAIVLGRMRDLGHERAYLVTSTARVTAIRLYFRFGFVPAVHNAEDEAIWREWRRTCAVPEPWPEP